MRFKDNGAIFEEKKTEKDGKQEAPIKDCFLSICSVSKLGIHTGLTDRQTDGQDPTCSLLCLQADT